MEPAYTIIKRLGGEAAVSRATGTAYTAPYRWQHPVDKGGTGGLIPQKHHPALLEFARQNGKELTPADFLPQARAAEAADCAARARDDAPRARAVRRLRVDVSAVSPFPTERDA
ncbi:hypothetical protein [Methylosinus sp. Sm6]|uniref:hypothetical protein n=1 Tax=Methylosinus sp. Sm6 TaxID=2866948 RepID=UPI001C990037|nr:hypothetical protein [Methylosinus sp. Sm6]MBY6242815.1 hypothetical protein [Methylosinus sp. Sm6]